MPWLVYVCCTVWNETENLVHTVYFLTSLCANSFSDTNRNSRLKSMLILTYLLTAIGLTPFGSNTVHIYTQTIHRTTVLVGGLSGIRSHIGHTKMNDELTA